MCHTTGRTSDPQAGNVNPNKEPQKTFVLFGRCRRHAPTMSGFPAVFGHDWCGDHKLDETKIPETLPGFKPPEDPWAHRATNMRCGACMYFCEKRRPGPVRAVFGETL